MAESPADKAQLRFRASHVEPFGKGGHHVELHNHPVRRCCVGLMHRTYANNGATFRDVLKPNGHERSSSEKLADGAACGTSGPKHEIQVIMPVFEKCMREKGWVLDHYTAGSPRPRSGSLTSYTDTHGDADGHPRGTAELNADSKACEAQTHGSTSARFKQCLTDRGWKVILAQYAPKPRVPAQPQWSWHWNGGSSGGSSNDDWVQRLDDQHHDDEMNQIMQQEGDATGAATSAQGDLQIQNSFRSFF